MRANEFVKKFGWIKAKDVVRNSPESFNDSWNCYRARDNKYSNRFKPSLDIVNISDLKRLIESHEIVECMGGLEEAKYILKMSELNGHKYDKTRKAIADVESCL